MKRLILTAGFVFGVLLTPQAQTKSSSKNSRSTSGVSATGTDSALHYGKVKEVKKNKKGKKVVVTKTIPLNERKNYRFKNGQTATPTGREATPVNGGYAALRKDTAAKKPEIDQ